MRREARSVNCSTRNPSPDQSLTDGQIRGGDVRGRPFRLRHPTTPFIWIQVLLALALAAGLTIAFFGLDHMNLERYRAGAWIWDPCLACEADIPYAPRWIWVYITYYPLCFSPLLLGEIRKERSLFWRMVGAYLMQFGTGFAFFLLLPSRMARPLVAGEGLTRTALEWVYRLDPGFNIFPSLHVSVLVFTAWLFGRFRGRAGGFAFGTAAALVSASAVLVKQHCLVDLVAGAALGTAAFSLLFPSRTRDPVGLSPLNGPS